MKTYIMKTTVLVLDNVLMEIEKVGGVIIFKSPILPIISAVLDDQQKDIIINKYNITYCIEEPIGKLQRGSRKNRSGNNNPLTQVTIIPDVNHKKLRQLSMTGWGTNIAILDSGINESWIFEQFDYSGFGNAPTIAHGTQVGLIIKQIAPGARISSYKVTNNGIVKYTDVLQAISDSVSKSDIINMSLGFTIESCTKQRPCPLCETVDFYTLTENKLFVSAAGNHGRENSIECPGNSQESVTVAALKRNLKEVADYSSRGVPGGQKPNIVTTGDIIYKSEDEVSNVSGTSFSTPIITGVIGALYGGFSKDTLSIRSLIYNTADDIGLPKHHQGFGLLNIDKIAEVLKDDKSDSKGEEQRTN